DFVGRPSQGLELRLSLDVGLQQLADDLLAGRPGAAVLLDATTGATLALASAPGYDPNRLATVDDAERQAAQAYWSRMEADPAAPLLVRPTTGLYPPGSTFKVLVAAAAIDQGLAGPETTFEDAGELVVDGHVIPEFNRPDETRTVWTLEEAVGWSLNVVFARIGLELGSDGLANAAERWGFGAPLPSDLPTVVSRLEAEPGFISDPVGLAETAFGQGQLLATPLQMALVVAGIANGGGIMRPWLVGSMADAEGDEVWRVEPGEWRRPVRPETAQAVARMMTWGVRQGAAGAAAIPGVEVGAKTGTAEAAEGQEPHAWFIGFAGRYAVAVVLDNAGGGGANALPVGRELLRAAVGAAG
ncbi:MAG TPA: penicillin-binding transpeptidase domain-containing protein, partial [Thermomicrobiales bacterium]|nr:penicillin-binding transpeptidase domain-containing protein [Thermomicrobiales bacterium]